MNQDTPSTNGRQSTTETRPSGTGTAPSGSAHGGFLFSEEAISWPSEEGVSLDELARWGAQRLIAAALKQEVAQYIERHASLKDGQGHALVVRNGTAKRRTIQVGAAPVEIEAPRVNDRRAGETFRSGIVPPYLRRSKNLEEAIPIFYLRGGATGDFTPALSELFGTQAKGFSPAQIVRMKAAWETEYQEWKTRDLSEEKIVYVYADGVGFSVRLEEDDLTCLAIIGVRTDGSKVVLALEDGHRESTEAWLDLLRDLKKRGLKAPRLAVGDGALGFWAALTEVYPTCRQQRCWVHKRRNVLDKFPERLQAEAKACLDAITSSETRAKARAAVDRFEKAYGKSHPKAVASLKSDLDDLLTYYDFPKEHWTHLRTTNPIESVFSPTKARTKKTKGAGSRKAGLAMAFKLMTMAESKWRRLNAPHLMEFVALGVQFTDGRIADPVIAETLERILHTSPPSTPETAAA